MVVLPRCVLRSTVDRGDFSLALDSRLLAVYIPEPPDTVRLFIWFPGGINTYVLDLGMGVQSDGCSHARGGPPMPPALS